MNVMIKSSWLHQYLTCLFYTTESVSEDHICHESKISRQNLVQFWPSPQPHLASRYNSTTILGMIIYNIFWRIRLKWKCFFFWYHLLPEQKLTAIRLAWLIENRMVRLKMVKNILRGVRRKKGSFAQ